MNTIVRLFALYREQAGTSTVEIPVEPGDTVADLLRTLEQQFPQLRLQYRPTLVAVNAEYAPPEQPLQEGDEVALIPPVSGGAHIRITSDPLDTQALTERVRRETNGAIVVFEGVTRRFANGKEVLHLEYEAFDPLVEKELARIAEEVRQKWNVPDIVVEHRIGQVKIGETSLVVVVGSPHRREAFQAIAEVVAHIKSTVPIWKKEFFTDGAVWVESEEEQARVEHT